MRALSGCRWHLDEVFVKIHGERHYLWRAVDQEGEVLEAFVSKKRDRKAALKFPQETDEAHTLDRMRSATDRLRSYRTALRELGGTGLQQAGHGGTIVRRISTCRSGGENTRCSVSGGCEASRNLPPPILPSTTTSTCGDSSAHGTISSSTAPLHLPSGVNSGGLIPYRQWRTQTC